MTCSWFGIRKFNRCFTFAAVGMKLSHKKKTKKKKNEKNCLSRRGELRICVLTLSLWVHHNKQWLSMQRNINVTLASLITGVCNSSCLPVHPTHFLSKQSQDWLLPENNEDGKIVQYFCAANFRQYVRDRRFNVSLCIYYIYGPHSESFRRGKGDGDWASKEAQSFF